MMILSSLKKVSIATVGAAALALGMSGAAMAETATVTAITSGIDSGFDSVVDQIAADPEVQAFFALVEAQFGEGATLGDVLADPTVQFILADPQAAAQTIDVSQLSPTWAPVVAALQSSDLLVALGLIDLPTVLSNPAFAPVLSQPIATVFDNETPDDFFTVAFNAGPLDEFIESITFDLGVDLDAAFDNRDFLRYDATPEVGQLLGLDASDITFSTVTRNDFDNANPTTALTVSFAQGSFGVGDRFTFGVDTNAVGNDSIPQLAALNQLTNDELTTFNDTGADFGLAGVTFSVNFENGKSGEGTFVVADGVPLTSFAQATVDVPEPGTTAALFTIFGAAAAQFGKRKKRK